MYNMTLAQLAFLAVGDLRQRAVLPAALPGSCRHAAAHSGLPTQFTDWNMVSSIGGFVYGVSQFLFVYVIWKCARAGVHADGPRVGRRPRARMGAALASAASLLDDATG